MAYNPNIHHRKSIRLLGYDYAQSGLYFITLVVYKRVCLFGEIVGANNYSPVLIEGNDSSPVLNGANNYSPILSEIGKIANACWLEIPKHYPNTVLHEYVIMPNHIHGIIEIIGANNHSTVDGANNNSPVLNGENNHSPEWKSPSKTIGSIVRGFKIGVTKWVRENTDIETLWQRNYYEHIIRNQQSYDTISNYILNNPKKWAEDKFFETKDS